VRGVPRGTVLVPKYTYGYACTEIANGVVSTLVRYFVRLLVSPFAVLAVLGSAYARSGCKKSFNVGKTLPFNSAGGCVVVPFGDMDANDSNGSSNYSRFTANLRKVFTHHYQFLASYTYSHAIDDSTDLQSPRAP
jgi:hypothetical protein